MVVVAVLLFSSGSWIALNGSTVTVPVIGPFWFGAVRCSTTCSVVPPNWPLDSWPWTVPPVQLTTPSDSEQVKPAPVLSVKPSNTTPGASGSRSRTLTASSRPLLPTVMM